MTGGATRIGAAIARLIAEPIDEGLDAGHFLILLIAHGVGQLRTQPAPEKERRQQAKPGPHDGPRPAAGGRVDRFRKKYGLK